MYNMQCNAILLFHGQGFKVHFSIHLEKKYAMAMSISLGSYSPFLTAEVRIIVNHNY